MTATPTASMPLWRTDDLYASLDAPELKADLEKLRAEVAALQSTFDELGIEKGGSVSAQSLERVLAGLNSFYKNQWKPSAMASAYVSTDSRNMAAQQLYSELTTISLPAGPLRSRLTAWLGGLTEDGLKALLENSAVAREYEHLIRHSMLLAQHQMSPAEEDLAARLSPSGKGGWSKLYSNYTSVLTEQYRGEQLPVTALRALASDPDEQVRKEAYEAEIAAWKKAELVCAAALSGVKGEHMTLQARRGFQHPAQQSLISNSIDQATLDAMQGAVVRALPDFRRYLKAKAKALGKPKLDWWDLFAPVGKSETVWEYQAGAQFVEQQFRGYSDKLGDFAAHAFKNDWVDAGPRDGKRSGAFCMGWPVDKQGSTTSTASRILMNHNPSLDSVCTLAHELGHGYHNWVSGERELLQRQTPMTLAETASIFCETIVQNAALEKAQGAERLYVLETQLMGHTQVVLDIHSRYLFEEAVCLKRAQRDLTAGECCELMLEAQKATYGDALATLHPYMWAAKPHYYGSSFYNYPYTFGLLFGLGIYAQYEQARAAGSVKAFQAKYDELLANTGLYDARTLAQQFGIDLHAPAFWENSLELIRGQIEAYVQEVEGNS